MSMSHQADIRKLIHTYSRRLQKFKEQQALHGSRVDPGILIEIEDIKEKIELLQTELEVLESVEESPPPPPNQCACSNSNCRR